MSIPHRVTDAELMALIAQGESDRLEFKEAWKGSAPTKGREAVCAFANDLSGHNAPGILLVGIQDNATPSGDDFVVTDELLTALADIKTDGKITPPPTMSVEKRMVLGKEVAVVTVWPADAPPVRFDGRIWIRTGSRRGQASAQDERILNEKRRFRDRTFDTHPVYSCPLNELIRSYFEDEYLPQAVARDVLLSNGRSYEERLASLGMIASVDDPTPTVVGILTLGQTPRTWIPCAYVQFLRIRGTELGDPVIDAQEIDGNLALMLRRMDEKIKATLAVSVEFTTGTTQEILRTPYPFSALQQLVRNAIMHRTYEGTNAPVRFYWFDDRIEIHNPGGPYGMVTRENFGRVGACDYRNPSLAASLKALGFVQRFGAGIPEARRAMKANANPEPEFNLEYAHVVVILRKTP